jgi:hypothetical protein
VTAKDKQRSDGRKGGKRRAEVLTADERTAIASKAAIMRWAYAKQAAKREKTA